MWLFSLISIGLILGTSSSGVASEVCGTNLVTYRSANEVFKLEDAGVNIGIAGFGSCKKVCALRDPICGSDARTYYNYCHLVFAYRRGEKVDFLHPGPCGIAGEYVGPLGDEKSALDNIKESKNSLGNLLFYKSIVEEAKGNKKAEGNKAKGDKIDLDSWTRLFAGDYVDPIDKETSIINKLTDSETAHENEPVNLEILDYTRNSQEYNDKLVGLELLSRVFPSLLNVAKKGKVELGNLPVVLKDIKGRSRYNQVEIDNLEQFLKHAVAGKYLHLPGKDIENIKEENNEISEADLDLLEQFLVRDVEENFEGSSDQNQNFMSNKFKDETIRETDSDNSKEATVHFKVNIDPSDLLSNTIKQNFLKEFLKQGKIYQTATNTVAKGPTDLPFQKRSKVEVTGHKVDKENLGQSHNALRQGKSRKPIGIDENKKLKFTMKLQLPEKLMKKAKPVMDLLGI